MRHLVLVGSVVIVCGGCISTPPLSCPAEDFGSFAIAFMNSKAVQQQWTNDFVDIASLEQPAVRSNVSKSSMKFPLIKSFQELTESPFAVQIGSWDGGNYTIDVMTKGEMIQHFAFREKGGCWSLNGMISNSSQ